MLAISLEKQAWNDAGAVKAARKLSRRCRFALNVNGNFVCVWGVGTSWMHAFKKVVFSLGPIPFHFYQEYKRQGKFISLYGCMAVKCWYPIPVYCCQWWWWWFHNMSILGIIFLCVLLGMTEAQLFYKPYFTITSDDPSKDWRNFLNHDHQLFSQHCYFNELCRLVYIES